MKRFDLRRGEQREEALRAAAESVQRGQLLLFPTDTLYGIGADALNEEAVERVLEAKCRPKDKPLLVLVSCLDALRRLCSPLSPWQKRCCDRLWPGPVTLLLPALPGLPDGIEKDGKIGVRLPAGQPVVRILEAVGRPLVAPSANRAGEAPSLTADEALGAFSRFVEIVLDNGPCANAAPSTVVDLGDGSFSVVRAGVLSEEEIREAVKE